MQNKKRFWEVPDVDLDFRHYSGHPSDAIKELKRNIEKYLRKPDVPQQDKEVYSAVFNALDYYKSILYSSAADFSVGPTFLNHSLNNMKTDYEYLTEKYNSDDPLTPPVITINGRIKSPISALEKIKDKIEEYLKNGTDLRYLNESLRDFMGVRIIVDPPQDIKDLGIDSENEYLEKVLEDLLDFHGINDETSPNSYKFIPINTKNNPHKLEKMQADGRKDNIPAHLIPFVKNYVDHYKTSGYQSYHICATPDYSNTVKGPTLPPCIIPPAKTEYSFEYQVRTKKMHDAAEHGVASHDDYKELGSYHRLSIPFYIEYKSELGKFKSINLEESCRKHFGYVPFLRVYSESGTYLRDMSLLDFRDLFTSAERDATIDGKKRIYYCENRGFEVGTEPTTLTIPEETEKFSYVLKDQPVPIFLTNDSLTTSTSSEGLQEILENSDALDSTILPTDNDTPKFDKPQITIFSVETSEDRESQKTTSYQETNLKNYSDTQISKEDDDFVQE